MSEAVVFLIYMRNPMNMNMIHRSNLLHTSFTSTSSSSSHLFLFRAIKETTNSLQLCPSSSTLIEEINGNRNRRRCHP